MPDMDISETKHLARLARIKITEAEATALADDISTVLDYVSVVNEITADSELTKKVGPVHNVFREDVVTNAGGAHTDDLLAEAPERDGRYLKVQKILNTD